LQYQGVIASISGGVWKVKSKQEIFMPIFEYKCGDCGSVTEFLEKAGFKGKHACEKCKSNKMEKMLSTFAPLVKQRASGGKCDSCTEHKCPYSQ